MGYNPYSRKPKPIFAEQYIQKPKLRNCLGCNKEFESAGPGNRRCGTCLSKEPKTSRREPSSTIRRKGRKGRE